jgi:hypothetical protein
MVMSLVTLKKILYSISVFWLGDLTIFFLCLCPLCFISTPSTHPLAHTQARNSGKSDEAKEARRLELAARQAEKADRDAAEAERVKVHGLLGLFCVDLNQVFDLGRVD